MTSIPAERVGRDRPSPPVLVVGASGFVGGALLRHFAEAGYSTLGTQSASRDAGLLAFDLASDRIFDELPPDFAQRAGGMVACIAAACANVETCGRDPLGTRRVNVTGTLRLIDDLAAHGCRVIWFSTSAVHNGRIPIYSETVPSDPINEYGRQKADVEQHVLSRIPGALVLRLSKVIDVSPAKRNLFSEWLSNVEKRQPIQCIANESFSPTSVADITHAVERLVEFDLCGLYHVANPECFTREQLARLFLQKLGQGVPLVLHNAEHFGFREPRPVSSCLDSSKLVAATKLRFTPMGELIELFLANQRKKPAGAQP